MCQSKTFNLIRCIQLIKQKNCSFSQSSDGRKFPEVISIKVSRNVLHHFSTSSLSVFLPSSSRGKNLHLWGGIKLEIIYFGPCIEIVITQNYQQLLLNCLTSIFNITLSFTNTSIPFKHFWITKFQIVQKFSIESSFSIILSSKSW